jgi:(R,R)-butanediol dehydrogenase / meso-butanediol dehydrogenase / diacetyl reductase
VASIRAVRLHGVRDVRLEEVGALPTPGPDEAAVAPLWCGLCGTDLKAYLDPRLTLGGAPLPLILGHEFSARVLAVGARVTSPHPGDEVAVMPLRHCGACALCRRGEFSLCPNKRWTGLGAEWGGLAECALVADYQLSPLAGIPAEAGALVEPAAVAMNAVERAGVQPGDTVLVLGCGPIGALVILAALAGGAATVLAMEPNAARASRAAGLGAELRSPGDIEGSTVDVAFDCAGAGDSLAACVSAVRPGGTVCVPAVHRGGTSVDVRAVTRANLSIVGSMGYTRPVWDRTLELIRARRLPVERVVTTRIAFAEIVERGFAALASPAQPELKVLVSVGSTT